MTLYAILMSVISGIVLLGLGALAVVIHLAERDERRAADRRLRLRERLRAACDDAERY